MDTPLNVLIVEASTDNLELLLRQLRQGGFAPVSVRVDTAESMRAALASREWDLVLSNCTLPGFNCDAALAILGESGKDIPLILISGTQSDEAALEVEAAIAAIKAGARDYIPKQHLERLAPAAHREMAHAAVRRKAREAGAELALKDAEVKRLNADLERRIAERDRYFNLSGDLICITSADGYFKLLNPAWELTLGFTTAELQARPFLDFIHPDDRQATTEAILEFARLKQGFRFENRYLAKDGSIRWLSWSASDVQDGLLYANARDITEMKLGQQRIQALNADLEKRVKAIGIAEHKFRSLLESAPDAGIIADRQGRMILVNNQTERLFGYPRSELLGKSIDMLIPQQAQVEHRRSVDGWFREPKPRNMNNELETRGVRKDGSEFPAEISLSPIETEDGLLVSSAIRDITEQRQVRTALKALNDTLALRVQERGEELRLTQEKLMHSQKLEAIGRLAGGIAHDFNNQLSVIVGFCDIALRKLAPEAPAVEPIQLIRQAGEKAASLTKQLLAFGRKQILHPDVLDLNQVVSQDVAMFKQVLGEDIDLTLRCADDLGHVLVDRGQLSQVLTNLLVNARDAMPDGGRLTIETRNAELGAAYAASHAGVLPGPYAMLSVSDTGTGIPREIQDRIFEPYFTTKKTGNGSGLGLAIVHGIVSQSGGHVWFYSEPGHGTTFKVYFPWVAATPDRPSPPAAQPPAHPPGWAALKTILVVEDEPAMRQLAVEVLGTEGYRILEGKSPPEALAIARERKDPIDLLLTDVIMPGMNGAELARQVSSLHPETRILFMSGYTQDAMIHRGLLDGTVELIEKPVTPDSLLHRVAQMLERPDERD